MTVFEQHVGAGDCTREKLDHSLDPDRLSWAQFDPEVGYILSNYLPKDGIDNSSTINTVQENGVHNAVVYADRDPDFMYEALNDDLMLRMSQFCCDYIQEIDSRSFDVLAESLGRSPDVSDNPVQQ